MDMARRPTLRDVAREAQLSVTQASRALNEHDDVAPATVERAKAAALKLGYTPNLQARRLRDPDTSSLSIGPAAPPSNRIPTAMKASSLTFGHMMP